MENVKNTKVIKVPDDARNGSVISPKNTMYKVKKTDGEHSGIHLILVTPDGLDGAADKRREGTVRLISNNY